VSYPAISVDLPWSLGTSARTVVAGWSGSDIELVTSELDDSGLERWITEHAAPHALVVLDYATCVRPPSPTATTSELARLSDEYDALLGLIAARAAVNRLPWSWRAEVTDLPGSIATIGTPWLRAAFAERVSPMRTRSQHYSS
jgi:hypothetical protein